MMTPGPIPPLPPRPPTPWTDGQWFERVDQGDDATYGDILIADADADDDGRTVDASWTILEAGLLTQADSATNRANLRLMASAPDLYDALARLRACLQTLGLWEQTRRRQPGSLWDACHRAEMALARAVGDDSTHHGLLMVGVDDDAPPDDVDGAEPPAF